ncbi:unnamed protein product [Arabis nemorensis]|uniref:Aminotransferase-like plant mobile domain-containing protein n=1 Tax=Arabis nemorensis TaxID=586526 RepID=A0A565BU36_9BRAS|nr:unnamed protein product [Arabis nemorensis]
MGLPWICSWHFNLILTLPDMPYSLIKEYRVKWWDKFNLDRCSLINITKFFGNARQDKLLVKNVSKAIPLLTTSQLTQIPPITIPSQTPSPTKSTSSNSSQKNKKKAKLKKALQTLSQELLASSDDEDSINQDDTPLDPNAPFGGPLAQDPFEDMHE